MSSSFSDDQLQPDDTLDDRGVDDALDGRRDQEEPDPVTEIDHTEQGQLDEIIDPDGPTDPADGFDVGDERTGRLTEPGDGDDQLPAAEEVGVGAGAASAEEAAMHTVDEDEA